MNAKVSNLRLLTNGAQIPAPLDKKTIPEFKQNQIF